MARRRKYKLVPYDEDDPGITSYPNSAIAYRLIGRVSNSGDLYISSDLAGFKAVTFLLREKEKDDTEGTGDDDTGETED